MSPEYSFRFVCQGGGLDLKAAFLAASLHHNLRCEHELIACIPEARGIQPPLAAVLAFLQQIGVRRETINNPLAPDYLIGHKLACLDLQTNCTTRVFLDSDILCLKPFHGFQNTGDFTLHAKLEDWNHHTGDEWNRLYRYLRLGRPEMRFRSTVLDQPMPLYFNAGVLAVAANSCLPGEWITLARDIDINLDLPRKRPNLDQLSLSCLAIRRGVSIQLLSEDYNYPAELRPLNHSRIPWFCHYHDPANILADTFLTGVVKRLSTRYGALEQIASQAGQWVWSLSMQERMEPLNI